MITFLKFVFTILNSLLKNVVINEPKTIPNTSKLPQPKLWSKVFHPPDTKGSLEVRAYTQDISGEDIAIPPVLEQECSLTK